MQQGTKKIALERLGTELYVAGLFKGEKLPSELRALEGRFPLKRVLATGDFQGQRGQRLLLYPTRSVRGGVRRLLVFGLGERKDLTLKRYTRLMNDLFAWLDRQSFKELTLELPDPGEQGPGLETLAVLSARIARTGTWSFERYRSRARRKALMRVNFRCGAAPERGVTQALKRGDLIGRGVNFARELATEPGSTATPAYLGEVARKLASEGGPSLKVKVLGEPQLKRIGAEGILAVGQGSRQPSRLVVLEYKCGRKNARRLAMIGKGVTFDTGGISIKPHLKMHEMKYDMCGAAAVLGVFSVIAELKPGVDLVGLVPAAENMPGGASYKPGDIIRLHCGKTVEIVNTDAEGRLLLCDALSYAERNYQPDAMVDFATLTGAVLICLGLEMSAVMGNDPGMVEAVVEAGSSSGDTCWPLPLAEEFKEQMRSRVADIRNLDPSRNAGTITAGAFLNEAVGEDTPWAHVDIAGTAWQEAKPGRLPGASGVGVHLVFDLLEQFASAGV